MSVQYLRQLLHGLGVEHMNDDYFQTWYWALDLTRPRWWNWRINRMRSPPGQHLPPSSKTLRAVLLQALCAAITGHEMSKTESGYGGGRFADKWCRWCNKRFKVPFEEVVWPEGAQDLFNDLRDGALP